MNKDKMYRLGVVEGAQSIVALVAEIHERAQARGTVTADEIAELYYASVFTRDNARVATVE